MTDRVFDPDEQLIALALRSYQRYQIEVIEGLNLCPWAKRAREEGHVRYAVCLSTAPEPEPVLRQMDAWARDDETEIGLILFPRLELERAAFERFASATMAADAGRHRLTSPPFVIAAFHPVAPLSLDGPDKLVPFLRRSPDPTFQVVAVSVLERVRQGESAGTQYVDPSQLDLSQLLAASREPLRDRIARNNLQTLHEQGPLAVERLIESIHDEHRREKRRLEALTRESGDAPQ